MEKIIVQWGEHTLEFIHDISLYCADDYPGYMPFISRAPHYWIMLHRYPSDEWFATYSSSRMRIVQSDNCSSAQLAMDFLRVAVQEFSDELTGVLNYNGEKP